MGKNYYKKRSGSGPSVRALAAREEQQRNLEVKKVAAAAYDSQDLPDVVIRDGDAFCPHASCGSRQRSLGNGIHTCTNNRCEYKMQVPENEVVQKIRDKLRLQLSRKAEREWGMSERWGSLG